MASRKNKNIVRRPGSPYWYFRARIRGRHYLESLNTTDATIATRLARERKKAIQDGNAEEWLEAGRVKRTAPTIKQIMDAYAAAPLTMINLKRERSRASNLNALRRVLDLAKIQPTQPYTALNEIAVGAYEQAALAEGLRPVSVRSYLRQAGSVVGGRTALYYRKIGLHMEGGGLTLSTSVKAPRRGKRLPPASERAAILAALSAMAGKPERAAAYAAFLLCYGLALRANEAAACRLGWFYPDDDGQLCCHVIARKTEHFDPKGAERAIPLDTALMGRIMAAGAPGTEHIIPGHTKTERFDAVDVELASAMREAGWPGPKYAHELRAWRGSEWWTQAGPQWAKVWLGHRSIATTEGYYASTTSNGKPVPAGGIS